MSKLVIDQMSTPDGWRLHRASRSMFELILESLSWATPAGMLHAPVSSSGRCPCTLCVLHDTGACIPKISFLRCSSIPTGPGSTIVPYVSPKRPVLPMTIISGLRALGCESKVLSDLASPPNASAVFTRNRDVFGQSRRESLTVAGLCCRNID